MRTRDQRAAASAADRSLVDMLDAPSGEEEEEAECQARRNFNAGHHSKFDRAPPSRHSSNVFLEDLLF